jgi:glucose-6-phosphate-specific signal transduction histidine kinase
MYRIIQEILAHIAKTSGITTINIKTLLENGQLILCIEDNESAYQATTHSSIQDAITGSVLSSISERATLSGGEFSISNNKHGIASAMAIWNI